MADVFDVKKTSVIVDGHYVTGWMDGSIITASKNEDNVIPHVGAKGEVSYSESNNGTGTITLTIKQNSPSFPKMVALAKGSREFVTSVVDTNTNNTKAGGNECRILKVPDVSWANEVGGVEIQIFVADYEMDAS